MAFGGFFGGNSSKDNNDSSTSTSTDSSTPSITNPLSSSFPPSSPAGSTGATLQRIQSAITEQSNVANAKQLISNVNTNCFEKCVPSPGSALTGGEQKCLTACMEKYIDAWNVTSRTYTARLQRESAALGGIGSVQAAGEGKSYFEGRSRGDLRL